MASRGDAAEVPGSGPRPGATAPAAARGARRAGESGEIGKLLERLRAGEGAEWAASRLAALLRGRLAAYFGARRVPPSDVDDLVQIVLQRVFSSVRSLRSGAAFEAWLFTIARNVACTEGERRGHDPLRHADPIAGDEVALRSTAADAEAELLAEERVALLEREIRRLPPRQRQCLVLRVQRELSYEEIGDLLGLTAHTVRNHLSAAREALRRGGGDSSEDRR